MCIFARSKGEKSPLISQQRYGITIPDGPALVLVDEDRPDFRGELGLEALLRAPQRLELTHGRLQQLVPLVRHLGFQVLQALLDLGDLVFYLRLRKSERKKMRQLFGF